MQMAYSCNPQYIGFRKKIEALSKEKGCEIVGEWQKSLLNHLYWSVSSTQDGDGDMIKAKWMSIDNHIHNVHVNDSDRFPVCAHPPLTEDERKKKWFKRREYKLYMLEDFYVFLYFRYQTQ